MQTAVEPGPTKPKKAPPGEKTTAEDPQRKGRSDSDCGDRSAAVYALVMDGLESGLTDEEIQLSCQRNPHAVSKYGDRLTIEVARIIEKEGQKHDHLGQHCQASRCQNSPVSANPSPLDAVDEINWEDFWSTPLEAPVYLLFPLLPQGRTVTVYAEPKAGKSLLGLEVSVKVATGGVMWGQELLRGHVIYVDQEMSQQDLLERLPDLGCGPDTDLSHLHYVIRGPWAPLDTQMGGVQLVEFARRTGASLVILDTQSKVLEGNENESMTMTNFFKHTIGPLKNVGVTVLIFDHSGKDPSKGARGSSQKAADTDVTWHMAKRGTDGGLTLKRTHSRTHHGEDHIYLQRLTEPLRHELVTERDRGDEVVQVCLAWLEAQDLDSHLSNRQVFARSREDGLKFRDETMAEALRIYRESLLP